MGKIRISDYVLVSLLLIFSTFEYFFRETILCSALLIACIPISLFMQIKFRREAIALILSIFVVIFLQSSGNLTLSFNVVITIFGIYCLVWITRRHFLDVFLKIMIVIAAYSILIYLLCLIPSINDFLYYKITPDFPSLNVEDAVFTGGGRNFIIYNFFNNYISKIIGFHRNCGPFWEPGMFAIFLNLALFINAFLKKGSWKINLLFIACIISSFSTGGYLVLSFMVLGFCFINGKSLTGFIAFIIALLFLPQIMELEFIGDKLFNQMNNYRIGDDASRFGAFYTQLEMIKDNFLFGGTDITKYATKTKTLASGLLMPLVDYGVIVGMMVYVYYYNALTSITSSYKRSKFVGLLFFLTILVMSFSQTILSSPIFFSLIFLGIIIKKPYGTIRHSNRNLYIQT